MKKRSKKQMILLTIVTLGLYLIYWTGSVQNGLKKLDGQGFCWPIHLLVSIFTLTIYLEFWYRKARWRIAVFSEVDMWEFDSSLSMRGPGVQGLAFIWPFMLQRQINGQNAKNNDTTLKDEK